MLHSFKLLKLEQSGNVEHEHEQAWIFWVLNKNKGSDSKHRFKRHEHRVAKLEKSQKRFKCASSLLTCSSFILVAKSPANNCSRITLQ